MTRKERCVKTTVRVGLCLVFALLGGSLRGQESAKPTVSSRPKTYGTDQLSYVRMPASEFTLVDTQGAGYTDEFVQGPTLQLQRYSLDGISLFVASPRLPSGALVTYFELDSCDYDPEFDVVASLYLCDDLGNCGDALSGLASHDNAIACGYTSADVSSSGIQVDNYRNQISIIVSTGSGTSSTRFGGVILGYKLQVSPPPLFPDFGDVPANHPFFQFVEALYNSGITAGCGSGNYCPDAPLTRGQMAVFLAKALGLQFQ